MTTTWEDARGILAEREAQYSTLPVKVAEIRIEPGRLCAGDVAIGLGQEGLERICQEVKAPFAYLDRLPGDRQADLLQYHLRRGDLQGDKAEFVIRQQELVGIERRSLHRLSSTDVLDAIADGGGSSSLLVHRFQFFQNSFQLDLLSEAHDAEVAAGDIVQAGLRVTHSFVGEDATSLEAFVLRLVCSNGLIHRECVSRGTARTRRLPASRPDAHALQMEQVRRLTADILRSLRAKLDTLKSLDREPVEFEHLMRRWLERSRLSTRSLWPLIEAAWRQEGGRSMAYDAMNALTRVATHAEDLDFRTRRALSSLAGILAFRQIHFCPRCFSILNS
jgi:hypothetical protein